MNGPKHLWSGDWQQESAAASQELANRRVKPDREPTISPTPLTRARRRAVPVPGRAGLRQALPILLVAVLVLAAGAYGLSALLGSSASPGSRTARGSSGPPATTAARQSAPAAAASTTAKTTSGPSRPVKWLGMQVQTLPPGAVVIETVAPGSPGELAGLEPGDVIVEINNRPISGTGDIGAAIRGLGAGDVVAMQISRGSTLYETEATLAAPPSRYP